MDPPLTSILKKRRLQRIGGKPIIECRREFTLPHKFPSMINTPKCNSVFEKFTTSNTGVQSSLNGLKSKKILATNRITKLRIKTKDGIDLGEVKVQLLTSDQQNLLNVPQIVKVQQTLNCMKNSVAGVSTSSPSNTVKIVKPVGSQLCRETQKYIRESHCPAKRQFIVSPSKMSIAQNKNMNVIQKHHVLTKVNKTQSNSSLNDNDYRLLHNVATVSKKNMKLEKTLVLINKQEIRDEHISKNNEKCIGNKNNDTLKKTKITDVKSSMIKLAESKFPIVRCERLQIHPTKVNINKMKRQEKENNVLSHENIRKRKRFFLKNDEWNHSAKRIENASNINSLSLENSENQKHTSILKPTRFDNVNDFDNDDVIVCEKNEIVSQHCNNVQEEKCTMVPVSNKNVDNETQNVFVKVNTKPNFDRNEIICKTNLLNENPEFDINHEGEKDIEKKEKLSECLNVIKEALTSVKDEQLRIKALHALAECGVGIAKQVPIIPPERLRTVHDSQIQTDVFGLLDRQSFVLVKETMSTIERIKQIERSIVNPCPVTKEIQTQTEMQIQTESKLHNSIYNTDLFSILEGPHMEVPIQDTLDIDNYFNEFFNDNNNINKVQKILSTPHSLCKKVATQLKKDYDELQYCDDHGMLNIHRAVVNNNLHEVQKLLLILRASKTSIDVLTEDGMTSLELAVQHNASESIVNLLLETGAKPISSELICDSAVLLASKQSSPLLPLLLNYVTEPQLLNREDSLGLAPLHYCALNGFLDGVIALIKVGADINLKDYRSGRTPFFHALENNYVLVAQKLLECGAIANLPNFSGQSVLSLIDETNNFSFKALLK